jgi:eukaryotic-like serine/threonine-protein kinase
VGQIASPDGSVVSYLVMEYLEGETLAARLARGPLSLEAALEYAGQMPTLSIGRIGRGSSIAT